jgi:hypothetical protein
MKQSAILRGKTFIYSNTVLTLNLTLELFYTYVRPFKADFIFGKRQKSSAAKSGWVSHFRNRFLGQKLLDKERLVIWSIGMVENPIVGPKFRPFPFTASRNGFSIST